MKKLSMASIAILAACSAAGGSQHGAVGKPAPDWSDPTISGSTLSSSSLQGKPLWLNFFATWCPPCNDEAPTVQAVSGQFASQGLQVVGVDVQESATKAKLFVDMHRLRYPAVVDTGTLSDLYSINGMPVNVFIDKSGVVRKIEIGQLDRATMIADVKMIL